MDKARNIWKAFAIWAAIPYLFVVLIVLGIEWRLDRPAPFTHILRWSFHLKLLGACIIRAGIGTMILWLVPIGRPWLGITAGALVALGTIAAYAWFAMTFFGGFEENVDIVVGALLLSFPSCVAGAYAGFLRFKTEKAR